MVSSKFSIDPIVSDESAIAGNGLKSGPRRLKITRLKTRGIYLLNLTREGPHSENKDACVVEIRLGYVIFVLICRCVLIARCIG
jgi:hypothetical protein